MSAGPTYTVTFDLEVYPDTVFELSTLIDLPSDIEAWKSDHLMTAIRNGAVEIVDDTLRISRSAP